ncbi:MAG: glycerate dehydrogenase [Acidobacteria bacterium]|nr:glycerate dehydrogenase [Acidobacteriota bacterium]
MDTIVYLDREAIRAPLCRPNFPHHWVDYPNTRPDQVAERLCEATLVLTNKVRLSGEVLRQFPAVRYIGVTATGTDCVDLDACRQLGITVTNVRNWCATPVAEQVFALIFALRRQIVASARQVELGEWQRASSYCVYPPVIPLDLEGSTLGIIGAGTIGRKVASMGTALGMKVMVADRREAEQLRPGRTHFETVLAECDIISLNCPLTAHTRHLISHPELELMQPHALLINCSRGGLIDARALAAALKAGRIGGAGIDVLETEPPPDDNPLLQPGYSNLIVSPHVAWLSARSLQELTRQVVTNLEQFVAGVSWNRVV